MKVVEKGVMPNGTHIQIEDWSEAYSCYPPADTLASYPKSKMTHEGSYAPKAGSTYRFSFRFADAEETKEAFSDLLTGRKQLSDFADQMAERLEYRNCI